MTVEEKLMSYLVECGMLPEGAGEVLEAFKAVQKEILSDYQIRYGSPADDYPTPMHVVWSIELDRQAVLWIDANCPHAWYRSVFAKGN